MPSPYQSDIEARFPDHTLTFTQNGDMWVCELKDDDGEIVHSSRCIDQVDCLLNIRRNLGVGDHVLPLLTTDQRRALAGDCPDGFQCMDVNTDSPHTHKDGEWYRSPTPHSKDPGT